MGKRSKQGVSLLTDWETCLSSVTWPRYFIFSERNRSAALIILAATLSASSCPSVLLITSQRKGTFLDLPVPLSGVSICNGMRFRCCNGDNFICQLVKEHYVVGNTGACIKENDVCIRLQLPRLLITFWACASEMLVIGGIPMSPVRLPFCRDLPIKYQKYFSFLQ